MISFSHPDFKLNEQQEAVIESFKYFGGEWLTAYQLVGFKIDGVTIGDAGRRMRVLREEGILDSPSDFLYNQELKTVKRYEVTNRWESNF